MGEFLLIMLKMKCEIYTENMYGIENSLLMTASGKCIKKSLAALPDVFFRNA